MQEKPKKISQEKLKKISELSMILVMVRIAEEKLVKPGRLQNLLKRARKAVMRELGALGDVSNTDIEYCWALMADFDKASKWNGERHFQSRLAFCLGLSDKWPKINNVLIDLHRFYTRAGKAIALCDVSGERAFEIWEEVCAGRADPEGGEAR